MRVVWACFGMLALALGLAGIVLPLLPTTPFLLLAAFCLARSSQRLHDWLVWHPRLGPPIRDWQANGAIAPRAKRMAMVAIAATLAISLALGFDARLIAVQALVLAGVSLFILTRPDGAGG